MLWKWSEEDANETENTGRKKIDTDDLTRANNNDLLAYQFMDFFITKIQNLKENFTAAD